MAQKYNITYNDVVNVEHEIQIFDDSYAGQPTNVQGRAYLEASRADDNLEAIRGLGLRVELEANSSLTYSDLYSEEEKTFPVKYYRNSVLLFDGWLNPEGWYEDFVRTDYYVSFDCVDGFGYLKNLSFVNSDSTPITGRKTQLEVLSLALQRTGLQKDICVAIDIYYTGLSTSVCVLDNVYVIADRYIKDDGETIMNCDEVIKDILEPYGAIIKSYADRWYIYKPNELYSNTSRTFYLFDYLGVAGTGFTEDFAVDLGSHLDGYSPHHAGENQSISIEPSIGAYRISYKYGLLQSLIDNTKLISTDGTIIDDWTVESTTNLDTPFPIDTGGVTFDNVLVGSSVENLRNDDIQIDATTRIDLYMRWATLYTNSLRTVSARYQVYVADDSLSGSPVNIYYLQDDYTWGSAGVPHTLETVISYLTEINITTPVSPIAGTSYFYISIYTPKRTPTAGGDSELREVRIAPNQDGGNVEGEIHTFQRTTKPSAQIKETKEVATGDNETDLYYGTIYKTDSTTPTETWFRNGITEAKPILQIMGEELMRMNQLPTRVFSGGVYGYISPLSVLTINNQSGKYMILEYSYDTKMNRIEMVSRQILGGELTDIDYELTYDNGNVVKPTIRG